MATGLYHEKQWLGHCAIHALNNLFQEQWVGYEDMCVYADALYLADKEAASHHTSTCLPSMSFNPYKSMIPYLGYFDISVIIKALETKQKGQFSGHITSPSDIDAMELPPLSASASSLSSPGEEAGVLRGFIVNVRQDSSFLGGLSSSRHWFSVLLLPAGASADAPDPPRETPSETSLETQTQTQTESELQSESPPATSASSAAPCCMYWNLDSKLSRPCCLRGAGELKAFLRGLVEQQAAHVFMVTAPPRHSPTVSE